MNQTVGAHALASRLVNAKGACVNTSSETATKPLWVDEADSKYSDEDGEFPTVGGDRVKRGLERVLGLNKAQKVDRSAIAVSGRARRGTVILHLDGTRLYAFTPKEREENDVR